MLATIATFLLENMMSALMLAVGLGTSLQALRATWAERRIVWRALLVLELGVPVLALATVRLLPVGFQATGVIAIMAVCPGAPMILKKVRDRPVVLVIVALVSLLAPISVAAWVALLDRALPHALGIRAGTLAQITLLRQVLPLVLGLGIAAVSPRAAAQLARGASAVFYGGFALALVLVLYKGAPELIRTKPIAIAAGAIVVFGSALMGQLAGRPRREDETALATVAVLGNPALATAVIAESYPGFKAGALMAAYLIGRALLLIVFQFVAKRWSKQSAGHPPLVRSDGRQASSGMPASARSIFANARHASVAVKMPSTPSRPTTIAQP